MARQTMLLTALPNGISDTTARVSVHVAPRLLDAGSLGADYPDWLDWPATLAGFEWAVELAGLDTRPATVVGTTADSARWQALFAATTPVDGHVYQGFNNIKLYSYPVTHVVDFLRDRWGRFGTDSPEEFPHLDDLLADDAFGPIGFESLLEDQTDGIGPTRKRLYMNELESHFDTTSPDPAKWAIPFDDTPNDVAGPKELAKRFLQLERFHKRGRTGVQPPTPEPPPPTPEFHDLVSLTRDYSTVMRLLGLVVDLEFDARDLASPSTSVRVVLRTGPSWDHTSARTACELGATHFRAIPEQPSGDVMVDGWLRLGAASGQYAVVSVDPDGGAIKSMQFADNLTRAKIAPGKLWNFFAPSQYAMPSPRSAGFSIARKGKASLLASKLANATALNFVGFKSTGEPEPGGVPELFLEDVVRGYRFEARSQRLDAPWRSLMEREGTYTFGAAGDMAIPPDDGEGSTVVAATSAGGQNAPPDLYAQESLVRWGGWSLAIRMVGLTVGVNDEIMDPDDTGAAPLYPFATDEHAKPGSLPRLRFGVPYWFRARFVDIAGNGLPYRPDQVAPLDAETGGPRGDTYLRHEAVESPVVVLAHEPTQGETNQVMVVRTDSNGPHTPVSTRHVAPPRASQLMAEHHGLFDLLGTPGQPLDTEVYDLVVALDRNHLGNHPDGTPLDPGDPDGERIYPVAHLDLTYDLPEPTGYLADPLAAQAAVRGLPPGGGGGTSTSTPVPFAGQAFPVTDTFSVDLVQDVVTTWSLGGRTLRVQLAPAEVFDVKVASLMPANAVDLFAAWQWIQAWVAKTIADPVEREAKLADLREKVVGGRHWMFTPSRTLQLVHAVRTPLGTPALPDLPEADFSANKPALGDTFAELTRRVVLHRKSTGRVDIVGEWEMYVDTGPGGNADPDVLKPFRAVATVVPIQSRNGGPDEEVFVGHTHEFGDTKYRSVTYRAIATSSFVEFFREQKQVDIPAVGAVVEVDPRGVIVDSVKVTDLEGHEFVLGTPSNLELADYWVDEGNPGPGTFTWISEPVPATVNVSYVAPDINAVSAPRVREIKNSARPAPPKVAYIVPTFEWTGDGTPARPSTRLGNSLRVYLERPWYSSGNDEKLAIVCWPGVHGGDVPPKLLAHVTQWGFDPIVRTDKEPTLPFTPTPASFLGAVAASGLSIPLSAAGETETETVNIAAYDVQFEQSRDLWYCDIALDPSATGKLYWPFVRLALARYQPHSLVDAHLSRVVLTDFAQVAPDRAVTVAPTRNPAKRLVTVIGRTYTANAVGASPSAVLVSIEERLAGVTDSDLQWQAASGTKVVSLPATTTDQNLTTWQGTISLPTGVPGPFRLVVEEVETHETGFEPIGVPAAGRRVVFTDILNP